MKNPYRYRGYRYDTETGLYYLQSRYYNPEWGRFLNADALLGSTGELLGHNVFAYCKNNVINRYDGNGYFDVAMEKGIGGSLGGNGGLSLLILIRLMVDTLTPKTGVVKYNPSIPKSKTTGTTITGAQDIPMEKRKSGMYYPTFYFGSTNAIIIDFEHSMNKEQATTFAELGGDVYTFDREKARAVASKLSGYTGIVDNHIDGKDSRTGVYFNHFNAYALTGRRIHIFFELPKIKAK